MSINVTVHGNPISIKRGKMVTYDADSDFERRRRIRLQQVREQSKEIAAEVRNRVRKEKEKQLSRAEKEGEEHLKRWKSRKLHALQEQYRDCVEQIGAAHARAAVERDPQEELTELAKKNQNEAEARARVATEKKKNEEAQERLLAARPAERKQYARKIENARSAMVCKLGKTRTTPMKKTKRKKVATDISVTNNIVSVSDTSENSVSDIENVSFNTGDARKNSRKSRRSVLQHISPEKGRISLEASLGSKKTDRKTSLKNQRKTAQRKCTSDEETASPEFISKLPLSENYTDEDVPSPPSFVTDSSSGPPAPPSNLSYKNTNAQLSPSKVRDILEQHRPMPMYSTNTRISDRIRQRKLNEDKELRNNNINFISNDLETGQFVQSSLAAPSKFNVDSYKICDTDTGDSSEQPKESNLPFVPSVSVRNTDESEGQTSRVRYYDHFNRFGKEYDAQPVVQKISRDSVVVHPPSERDESKEFYEIMQRRDAEALCRGAKAMEKNKIQKDYKQLLEELPALQRQERLAQMRTHNPSFHMSEDRYQELERRRQNRIENIFEKYYHKCKNLETPLITIKPVQQQSPPVDEMKAPFTALDVSESPVQLNVAEWRTGAAASARETNVRCRNEVDPEPRTSELADLLQRVNKQRELLIQEVSNLPPSSNLQNILQDEAILNIACPCPKTSAAPKSSEQGKVFVSTGTSPLAVISASERAKETNAKSPLGQGSGASSKREIESSNGSDTSVKVSKKKHKKVKVKKHTHVSKDEETQTSPATCKKPVSPMESSKPSQLATSSKSSEDKSRSKSSGTEQEEKLCQIIIKIADESSVEISTLASSKQVSVKRNDSPPHAQTVEAKSAKEKAIVSKAKEKPKASKVKDSRAKQHATPTIYQRRGSVDVSSSTAYLSPPDIQAAQISAGASKMDKHTLYKDMLKNKPQQTNIDRPDASGHGTSRAASSVAKSGDGNINPHLLKYVQKLLRMSRQSIDELTVSTASDVSTPGPNVTDSADNTPIIQLHNVMSHFNLSFSDIQKYLSSETSFSSNTNVEMHQSVATEDVVHRDYQGETRQSVEEEPQLAVDQEHTGSPLDQDDAGILPYSNILSKFAQLAQDSCEKISNLTSMIDKIRLEKERLLSPLSSDKNDNSYTSYMDLPPKFASGSAETESNRGKQKQDGNSSGSNSASQDAVDQYLLGIGESIRISDANVEINVDSTSSEFVPMLGGIPKYDENENAARLNFLNPNVNNFAFNTSKPKPPPVLLRNAVKYNLNIDMTPHELSTIVEMDTVASSRNVSEVMLQRPRSPDDHVPSKDVSDRARMSRTEESSTQSGFVTISPERPQETQQSGRVKERSKKVSPKSAVKKSRNKSPSQDRPVSKAEMSGIQPLSFDKSSSSPEDREAILRNMGLGWAVSTLKKTQESLALSSSSDSSKKHVSFKGSNSSNSDVSLKEVLSRQFLKKISSSTLTDSGSSPSMQGLQDISEIAGAAGSQSRDRSQRRTSTPVQHSKSTDSKKNSKDHLFTGDSDLSSVRLLSDDNLFLSIPDFTLDTNKSLNKSKK